MPDNSDLDEWADYIEIRCLLNPDNIFTLDAVIDDVHDAEVAGDNVMDQWLDEDEESLEEDDLLPKIPPEIYEVEIPNYKPFHSQREEKEITKLREAFRRLESRSRYLEDSYPFEIESGKILKVKTSLLDDAQKTYVLLLISSNLRLATPSGITRIGNLFEKVCGPFFKLFLPSQGEYHHFGAGAEGKAIFKGPLSQKLAKLCEIFQTRPSQQAEKGAVSQTSGDGGLDWIGFQKFKDRPWYIPVFFAQCACGKNYLDKQFEAGRAKWEILIDLPFPTFSFLFTPRCHRNEENELSRPEKIINELVMIDRFRLMEVLKWEKTLALNSVGAYQEVLNEFYEKVDSI